MPLYNYYTAANSPRKLAKRLGLIFRRKPGPPGQFYKNGKPVGYIVREGIASFIDELEIPPGVLLEKIG